MNYLTEKKYVFAWSASFLQRDSGGTLPIAEITERYERDTRIRFDEADRGLISKHAIDAAAEIWKATATDAVLSGVSFRPPETIFRKPVLYVHSDTVINVNSKFNEKGGLSTRGAGNCGVACGLFCAYCSSGAVMKWNNQTDILRVLGLDHSDVVIRRLDPLETARRQLTNPDGSPLYADPEDTGIVELASIVDPLATPELMRETTKLARLIFELTHWRVRVLSKSRLLAKFARQFVGDERRRLLLGFSIGIPEDDVARSVEVNAAPASMRFRLHRELLEEGFPMFGMSCPVLAVPDFRALAERIAAEIQPERLEKVWCEAINVRGDSIIRTIAALKKGGHDDLARRLGHASRSKIAWEIEYNRRAFLGFKEVMGDKLAYLTYVTPESETWWSEYAKEGAVLL